MWLEVEHVGGGMVSEGGGIETSRVVDVPSERIASPGEESVTIVDGLSPVKGATTQSKACKQRTRQHLPFAVSKEDTVPGEKWYRSTHQRPICPRTVPPLTGSPASFPLNSLPPHASRSVSSHVDELRSIRFIPLASEDSMGAMSQRNREARKEDTREMCCVCWSGAVEGVR